MVVMILAAFLVKSRQRRLLQWVWVGVLAALAVTVGAFLIIHFGTKTLTSLGQELVGGISSLIAVGLVSYLLLWMRGADKNMSRVLNDKMETAAASGPLAVIVLAFTAVAREGIETALLVFDTFAYGDTVKPALGLSVGIAIAIVVTLLMYRGAIRINLSVFFRITGVLLIVVAAGILRYGINDLQEAGVLPGPEHPGVQRRRRHSSRQPARRLPRGHVQPGSGPDAFVDDRLGHLPHRRPLALPPPPPRALFRAERNLH